MGGASIHLQSVGGGVVFESGPNPSWGSLLNIAIPETHSMRVL